MNTKLHHYIVPLKIYFGVALALVIFTVITVAVSFIDLEGVNIIIALSIAAVKASLVLLFFMHLKYDWKMNAIVFLAAIAILAIFMVITMFDVAERGALNIEMEESIRNKAVIYDESGNIFKEERLTLDDSISVASDSNSIKTGE